ncbi:MAG: DUF2298 domain-containing protein [Chloroflexi bacterium]|nr:DUF2298 domain-containing protein [Chloroflexota bacterium]
MRQKLLPSLALALILVYGAVLRFSGQNWDDFSHSHPDERFLTALLLPQIGGGNSFTADARNYPEQEILVAADNFEFRDWETLRSTPSLRLGVLHDTFAAEASTWLVDQRSVTVHDNDQAAEVSLLAGTADALLIDRSRVISFTDAVRSVQTLGSEDLQALHCKHRYPEAAGSGGYFDARCSPLNPHNAGHGFYVYGTFPLFLAHFGSEFVRNATASGLPLFDFQGGHLVWRGISAIFDLLTILAVFALGKRIHGTWAGVFAALFYAAAPLAIQKAHFGTVNAVASFLVTAALYLAVCVQQRGRYIHYLFFGLFTGAAVASRINLAPLAGIILVAAGLQAAPIFDPRLNSAERVTIFVRNLFGLVLAGTGAFLAFRILNPYAFVGPGFFGLLPNHRWIQNLESISAGVSGAQDFPPNWQWLARSSFIYTQKDMLFWAMGLGFGVLGWFGWLWSAYRVLRNRSSACDALILVIWIGGYYLFMSRLAAQTMRYYLPLYSSLAVLAGWCLVTWQRHARSHRHSLSNIVIPMLMIGAVLCAVGVHQVSNGIVDAAALTALLLGIGLLASALIPQVNKLRPAILSGFAVLFSLIWGLMFSNIYRHQTTLVQSARYIFEHVPGDFAMEIENSDDSLPLINIAFHNTGYLSSDLHGSPFDNANQYREGDRTATTFQAPASGTITKVYAPHLGDPFDDPQPEEILIQVLEEDSDSIIAQAALRSNLERDSHPLGAAYTIAFDRPFEVVKGARYSFVVEVTAGSGDVIGSGSVLLNEGSWDNQATGTIVCQLPEGLALADDPPPGLVSSRDCRGEYPFSGLINSQDQIMSFPVDNQVKYDDIVRTLDIGDYLTIASNRFYDTQPRNQMRWPLTTLYYEKLFSGELGFTLEAMFEETFEFGPWRVADQRLPIHDSPYWLNELEADEAFHVYDHPTVFIFRKTADYSRANVEAILSQVSLRQAHELRQDNSGAQFLGVFYWLMTDAEPVPTGLTFTPPERDIQTSGGTWSDRFFSDSIVNTNQAIGVIIWYATIFLFGALAFPLVFAIFPKMADGGYGVSKLVGMLLVAWLAWAVSSLKIPVWSQAGILFSLVLLAFVSALLVRVRFVEFLRDNWKRLAWIEFLAFVAFLALIVVRLSNPDLWHPAKGGEKPMDFAYLNGVLRSTTFPPIDPWLSGGFINYYYFGYVLVGAPALLLGVVPAFAYNLMIPTIFSLTGIGAFSAAFNMFSQWQNPNLSDARPSKRSNRLLGKPWVAGIMALLLCVVLGNLDTVRVIGNEVAALGGYRRPEGLEEFLISEYQTENEAAVSTDVRAELARQASELHPWDSLRYEFNSSLSLVGGLIRGAGKLLAGESPYINSDRWYWGPSRVLAETPGVRGNAITEMPYFTFLYGDLHAHMINMPLILLTVLLLFNEVAQAERCHRSLVERAAALALAALTVGVMRATNTWDWPTMSLLSVLALAYAWSLRWKASFRPLPDKRYHLALVGLLVAAAGFLSFLAADGSVGFRNEGVTALALFNVLPTAILACVGAVILWIAARYIFVRASALEFLAIVGGFLALNLAFALPYTSWHATTYNSVQLWRGGKTPLWAYADIHGLFLFLTISLLAWDTGHWFRNTRVKALIENKTLATRILAAFSLAGLMSIAFAMIGYQVALIVLPTLCWIALLLFRPGQSEVMRFALVLVGLALSITLGVEVLVIGGDIGRQNTVFKFYIQVWLLLSVAGGLAFACLLQAAQRFSRSLKIIWYTPCILLIGIAGLFPIAATRGRSFDRMAPDLPLTLNGMDFMTQSKHVEFSPVRRASTETDLAVDHQLIRWLQENVEGSPVIIEGRQPGSEYRWNGRISIMTGLPSVLGWNWHQRQQRTFHPMHDGIFQRERNILQFYDTADIDIAVDIIHHFDITYIIRSGLEQAHSTAEGLQKLDRMVDRGLLDIAYEVPGGKIYQVNEDALLRYLVERGA